MKLAYERWLSLHEKIRHVTGYERIGHIQLIERPRDLAAAPAIAWMQNQQGIPTEVLSTTEARALEPYVSDQVTGAIFCPLDGVADHTETTRGLGAAADSLGVDIRTRTRLKEIERAGDRVVAAITTDEERIAVDKALILLTNTHVPLFLADHFGLTLPVWPRLPQAIFTEPLDLVPLTHLVGHAHRRLAMKPGPDYSVMISGGWLGKWSIDGGRAEVRPEQVEANRCEAVAVYPVLKDATIQAAYANRPESDCVDHIPVIDRTPGVANMFFATGWAGHGWAIAPAVCELLAAWIFSGQQPALLRPFAYDRFCA